MTEVRVAEELAAIRRDLEYIKEYMVDANSILTKNEEAEDSMKEFEEKKTVSLKNFRRFLKYGYGITEYCIWHILDRKEGKQVF